MTDTKQNIINILLITSDNCEECDALEVKLRRLMNRVMFFKLSVFNTNDYISSEGLKIFITPALIVNGKLQFYGDVPENKLYKILFKQIKNGKD